jgi:hypothetical protein
MTLLKFVLVTPSQNLVPHSAKPVKAMTQKSPAGVSALKATMKRW